MPCMSALVRKCARSQAKKPFHLTIFCDGFRSQKTVSVQSTTNAGLVKYCPYQSRKNAMSWSNVYCPRQLTVFPSKTQEKLLCLATFSKC